MDTTLIIVLALAGAAVFLGVGVVLRQRSRQKREKIVSTKLKDGEPPHDTYPMW